ncbi:MAG: RNA polymerase sigma factor, partial [Anaerolineae bacterium 49_20]
MARISDENKVLDEERDSSALDRLLEFGRKKRYVTYDDILHFFPEAEQDLDQLEEAYTALLGAGINYTEEDSTSEEPSDSELSEELEEEEEETLDDLANIDTDDTIGLYLKEVSRVPLLSDINEERALAIRIERGKFAREELARGNVSPKRRLELRQQIEDGWQAREHLIT